MSIREQQIMTAAFHTLYRELAETRRIAMLAVNEAIEARQECAALSTRTLEREARLVRGVSKQLAHGPELTGVTINH